jgi:prepilin-type N-terminal cleavage/methylation domain-containing protein
MYFLNKTKKAFTMIELVFVIVILGIVASISSELIAKVYGQYIVQRAQHRSAIKTELAASQIENRFNSAIPNTVYRIKFDGTYESIETASGTGDDYIGIQWIGADSESFSTASTPGWSGFCDLNDSDKSQINTDGSQLSMTDAIISYLYNGKTIVDSAVFFPNQYEEHNISGRTGEEQLNFDNTGTKTIAEQYKLAWSSYALIVENGDLYLYYNFEPSIKKDYTSNSQKALLLKNVTTFKFKGDGGTLRFKICKSERISEDVNLTSCKEKAVF